MKDTNCCIFHVEGGPAELACDNYGRDGEGGLDAGTVDYDREPLVTFGDLIDWDIYSDSDAEAASMAAEAREDYGAAA